MNYEIEHENVGIVRYIKNNRAKRFVYASSSAAYGIPPSLPLNETESLNPESPYGLEKKINELYVKLFRELYGISACGLRYFNVYGPRQDPKSPYAGVIALFADAIQSKQPFTIYGDGLQTRDFIYVNDVARTNTAALNSDYHGILNVATGISVNLLELIEALENIAGYKCDKQFKSEREGEIKYSAASVAELSAVLNVKAKYSLEEGLLELLKKK